MGVHVHVTKESLHFEDLFVVIKTTSKGKCNLKSTAAPLFYSSDLPDVSL